MNENLLLLLTCVNWHLLGDAKSPEPLFCIAVQVMLSVRCYIFLTPTEVLWKEFKNTDVFHL